MKARASVPAAPAGKPNRLHRPARTWRERVGDPPPRRRRRPFRSEVGLPRPRWREAQARWRVDGLQGSRLAAFLLAGVLLLVMAQFFLNDLFYIYRVEARGTKRLTEAMLFEQTGVAGFNIFWVDPRAVQQNLLAHPYIRSAEVRVALPNRLSVTVEEREPRLAWALGDAVLWADETGTLLPPTDEILILPMLVDEAGALRQANDRLSQPTVAAVLQFHALVPPVMIYRYSKDLGLHFQLPDQTMVYLGDEAGMREKVALLNALRTQLATEGTQPQLIDLRYKGSVYYR